jgi:hypothetical protein
MAKNRRSFLLRGWLLPVTLAAATVSRPISINGLANCLSKCAYHTNTTRALSKLSNPIPALKDSHLHETGMIPIYMGLPAAVQSGATFNVSVTVNGVPTGGGYVLVGCNQPGLLTSPSGSWPYHLQYVGCSSTTAAFAVQSVSGANTSVTFFACPSDANPNDPSQWSVSGSLSLESSPP